MKVKIRPQDIGNFKSEKQLRAYNSAQNLIKDTDTILKEMMNVDDVVDIDFNNKAKGDVLVQRHELKMGEFTYNISGITQFDPSTKEVKNMNISRSNNWHEHKGDYTIKEKSGFFGLGALQMVYKREDNSEKEVVTINKKTNEMVYEYDWWGIEG